MERHDAINALSDYASLLSATEDGEAAAKIEMLQRTPWPSSMMQEAATMLTRLSARVKELEAPHTETRRRGRDLAIFDRALRASSEYIGPIEPARLQSEAIAAAEAMRERAPRSLI